MKFKTRENGDRVLEITDEDHDKLIIEPSQIVGAFYFQVNDRGPCVRISKQNTMKMIRALLKELEKDVS